MCHNRNNGECYSNVARKVQGTANRWNYIIRIYNILKQICFNVVKTIFLKWNILGFTTDQSNNNWNTGSQRRQESVIVTTTY